MSIHLPYSDELNIGRLSRLFDNTSEYQAYNLIWNNEAVHKEFDKCAKEHINIAEIQHRIYREGLSLNEFANGLESVV